MMCSFAYMVAPFTGAWIETLDFSSLKRGWTVAPFTGAWIETRSWPAWVYSIGPSLSEAPGKNPPPEIGKAENQGRTRSRLFPFEGVMDLTSFHALAMPRSIR